MSTNTNKTTAPATTPAKAKDPLDADFTYLQTAEPGPVAELHAALISKLSGVEISAQQVRAVLSMHGKIQASEANRKREGYVARTAQSIRNGGQTTVEHMDLRLAEAVKPAAPKPVRKPRTPKPAAPKAPVTTDVAVAS